MQEVIFGNPNNTRQPSGGWCGVVPLITSNTVGNDTTRLSLSFLPPCQSVPSSSASAYVSELNESPICLSIHFETKVTTPLTHSSNSSFSNLLSTLSFFLSLSLFHPVHPPRTYICRHNLLQYTLIHTHIDRWYK